jgi:DNA topoisomerase-1
MKAPQRRAGPRATATSKNVVADEAAAQAIDAGLVYVSDEEPGITRRRSGKGFGYRAPDGSVVRDQATLQRIRALAIPPAYTEVWICRQARGHLQATGRDARRRKQYRYHAQWSAVRGDGKFDRIVAFGRALPKLRRRLRRDLALPGYPREKVLAIVVSVMAETLMRVGNNGYARDNKSFGLTTLRNRHAEFVRDGRARLRFKGKGGQDQEVTLDDKRLVKLVRGTTRAKCSRWTRARSTTTCGRRWARASPRRISAPGAARWPRPSGWRRRCCLPTRASANCSSCRTK